MNKVNEIHPKEVMRLMVEDKDNEIVIVDVREAEELEQGMIEGALHIPLQSIPDRINELNKEKHHIFVCHSGVRSLHAAVYVSEHGMKGTNMIGGMVEWPGKVVFFKKKNKLLTF